MPGLMACLYELLQLLTLKTVSVMANKVILVCVQVERQSLLAW